MLVAKYDAAKAWKGWWGVEEGRSTPVRPDRVPRVGQGDRDEGALDPGRVQVRGPRSQVPGFPGRADGVGLCQVPATNQRGDGHCGQGVVLSMYGEAC